MRAPALGQRVWPLLCLVLSGCGSSVDDGVVAWMQAGHPADPPQLRPLPDPPGFLPQPYGADGLRDPFATERRVSAAGERHGSVLPDAAARIERRRGGQPLEAFALDEMSVVGSLSRQGQWVALIKVAQQLHLVQVGDYLGQHQGRVHRITENSVELRERVPDANGRWTERPVSLPFHEEPRP